MNDALGSGLAGRGLECVRGERTVFSGLDFAVPPGGALVLRGPNGSGKSSLLRLIAGLLEPAAGTIAWNGEPVDDDAEAHHARLRYVGHLDAVKPAFTAAENLEFWMRLGGGGGGRAAVARALDRLGIGGLAEVPAGLLSAGQRRRLALARLAAIATRLWLLDEPTVALDEDAANSLLSLVAEHRAGGGTVIVATHQPLALDGTEILRLGEPPG